MASRASLNKVLLIGNLTRDPELRYTPHENAVCTFGLATNRVWVTDGQKREDTQFHRIVCWNKLAELCKKLLTKGRKVFVEGRIQTRSWQAPDGTQRQTTEIVIDDMRILDSRREAGLTEEVGGIGEEVGQIKEEPVGDVVPVAEPEAVSSSQQTTEQATEKPEKKKLTTKKQTPGKPEEKKEELNLDDLPF